MTILEQVNKKINEIRKTSDPFRVKALIMFKADLIDNTKAKKPQNELKVALAHHKSILKTIQVYRDNNCHAHADQFTKDASYVAEFLPKQMSDEEVVSFIEQCFNVHIEYENLTMGEIIGKIKKAIGDNTSNGKLIAQEVKRNMK